MEALRGILEQLNLKPGLLLTQIAGFLLVLAILRKYLFGPIQRLLQEREERVREHLERAEQERAAMEGARGDYEKRLAAIESEARDRIQQAMQQAEDIRHEIIEKARSEAQRVLDRAREDIATERQKALVELRDEMALLAVRGAEKIIEGSLDEATQRRLISSFLSDLERQQ